MLLRMRGSEGSWKEKGKEEIKDSKPLKLKARRERESESDRERERVRKMLSER